MLDVSLSPVGAIEVCRSAVICARQLGRWSRQGLVRAVIRVQRVVHQIIAIKKSRLHGV